MKKFAILSMVIGALLTGNKLLAQDSKTATFKVYGNCGMCKKRIEKATAGEGITKADWNVDTKILTVTYASSKITDEAIQKKIAAAGHDTEKQKAVDTMYNKLPACCQYDRKDAPASAHGDHNK